jgi:hypothetical protein
MDTAAPTQMLWKDATEKLFGLMTPWQKRKWLDKAWRRAARKSAQAAFRAKPGAHGYCCPRCHKWHQTPTLRAVCRRSHLPQLDGAIDAARPEAA